MEIKYSITKLNETRYSFEMPFFLITEGQHRLHVPVHQRGIVMASRQSGDLEIGHHLFKGQFKGVADIVEQSSQSP